MFQAMTTVYAVEVMPTCLRAYLTSYVNCCWVCNTVAFVLADKTGKLTGCHRSWASSSHQVFFAAVYSWKLRGLTAFPLRCSKQQKPKLELRQLTQT